MSFEKATDVIRKYNQSTQVELAHFRLIASTSTLLLIFSHEVKSLLGLLEQNKNSLTMLSNSLENPMKDSVLEMASNFNDLNKRLEELLELTSLVSADKTKTVLGSVALKSKLNRVEKVFELILKKYDIILNHDGVANNIVLTKISEAELYSILLNVLSNSIKAVISINGDKKINISAQRQLGKVEISVMDNGIGLNPEYFQEVFIPFVSDPEGILYKSLEEKINPEDKMIVGTGTGLGLGIVKEIVHAHNGKIEFVRPINEWSTEIKITLI